MAIQPSLFEGVPNEPQPKPKKARVQKAKPEKEMDINEMKLFYRPHEIMKRAESSVDQPSDASMDELWSMKRAEVLSDPKYKHIYEDIRQNGIRYPVTLHDQGVSKPWGMGQGHHRVVMAKMLEEETGQEQYIPAVHSSDWDESTHIEMQDRYVRPTRLQNTNEYRQHLIDSHHYLPDDFGTQTHRDIMKNVHEREHNETDVPMNRSATGTHFHERPSWWS